MTTATERAQAQVQELTAQLNAANTELAELRQIRTWHDSGMFSAEHRRQLNIMLGRMPGITTMNRRANGPATVTELVILMDAVADFASAQTRKVEQAEHEQTRLNNTLAGIGEIILRATEMASERREQASQ